MADETNVSTNVVTAETETETVSTDNAPVESEGKNAEELMAEIAQIKADMARQKNALDKALREKGEITKKLREKQTAEEAEAEERAEAEAERAEREAEKDRIIATYEAKAMFAEMGLQGKDLEDAINAKLEGDEKAVYSIIIKYFEHKYETALKTEKNEWLGNRPPVNVGVSDSTLTKAQFDRMGYKERLKIATEHPELYAQLTK